MMRVTINEQAVELASGTTLLQAAELCKPGADILIVNGFPAAGETVLQAGDTLYLIKRGEQPSADELEFLMAARHTPGVHSRLKQACVGIAGVGGLGSAVAVALARIGVGRLILADFDIVEPSNLNRQQFFVDQIGLLKVYALADTLRRINPYIMIEPHAVRLDPENIPAIFAPCPVIVEAFDLAEMKAMLVDSVLEQLPDSSIIAASGVAGFGDNNGITTRRISARFYLVGDGSSEAAPGNGLMAPRVAIAAGQQANQAVRLILGEEP